MQEPQREGQENSWVGKTLLNKSDIEKAWKEYDEVRGERLFCRDKEGRILEITGGIDSPLYPIVKFVVWEKYGTDNENPVDQKLITPEFLKLQPTITDIDEEENPQK